MSRTHSPVWLDPIAAPLAAVYGGIVNFRNHAYDNGTFKIQHVSVPVISIGGITAGGAGKTPLAIWTLEKLIAQGIRCGLVSRGYKRKKSGTVWMSRGDGSMLASAEDGGDEPRLIAERLPRVPVICDADRVRGGTLLIEQANVQAIVLDDGFQHRRLARDLDWVSIDTALTRRALRMLPWGYLRERFLSINRASAAWIKVADKEHAEQWITAIRELDITLPLVAFRLSETGWKVKNELLPLESLRGCSGLAFAGIAHPARFQNSLKNAGVELKQFIPLFDHHSYNESDTVRILERMKKTNSDYLFTTEKDYVKLPEELRSAPIAVLRIEVEPLSETAEVEHQLQSITR